MLHEVSADGGLGFCHDSLPEVLPPGYHGPLVVALDSNVLIDLQSHGLTLMDDWGVPATVARDKRYANELAALGKLIDLWLLRDIRFIVTPRCLTDARGRLLGERFVARAAAIQALADSLAFQAQDWTSPPPSDAPFLSQSHLPSVPSPDVELPEGGDRDLVLEAIGVGAHVFLTRDRRVLRRAKADGLAVLPPTGLMLRLGASGANQFSGGVCARADCPYVDWPLPAPDIGKWGALLSIMGGEEDDDPIKTMTASPPRPIRAGFGNRLTRRCGPQQA